MMSEAERPVCLIPARGGSRRFPRKNIAPLRGRPLLAWAVEVARESKLFHDVWVSTDDAEIAAIARGQGAQVHERPAALATDTATIGQVGVDFLDWLAARFVEVMSRAGAQQLEPLTIQGRVIAGELHR